MIVPKNQHTFIKFRWWNDHNINEDPSDFVMCAHVFGEVSRASYANYVSRRTSLDNAREFGKEGADVV